MPKRNLVVVNGFGELLNENVVREAIEQRKQVESLELVIVCNKNFDEWDIEKYIDSLVKINPDLINIKQETSFVGKPTYHCLKEVQFALEHHATSFVYDETSECQEYVIGGKKVIFQCEYIK